MVTAETFRDWSSTHGLRILFIIVLVLVARIVLLRAVPPAIHHALVHDGSDLDRVEFSRRAETVSSVILRTAAVVIVIVEAFFILAEVGFNIAPVIAGVSISGIALGLGAQTLVKDGINGLFILGENQFAHGDMITVAGVTGIVEEVNLRRTVLRGEDGTVYTVPNSAIAVAGNHTRGYSGIYFTLGISYLADLERAISEIDRVGAELAADAAFSSRILQPPKAVRIDSLEDTYLNLRISGRVVPGAQTPITGELRRRILEDFDRLEIAYRGSPHAS